MDAFTITLFEEHLLSDQSATTPAGTDGATDIPVNGANVFGDVPSVEDEIEHWVRIAVAAADAKLGRKTEAFQVGEIMAITDWFVITSGRNSRQVRAIVESVEEQLIKAGGPKPIRIEGSDTLTWVLVDYGIFVVHVFTDEAREYYDLERLWKDVPRLDRASA